MSINFVLYYRKNTIYLEMFLINYSLITRRKNEVKYIFMPFQQNQCDSLNIFSINLEYFLVCLWGPW